MMDVVVLRTLDLTGIYGNAHFSISSKLLIRNHMHYYYTLNAVVSSHNILVSKCRLLLLQIPNPIPMCSRPGITQQHCMIYPIIPCISLVSVCSPSAWKLGVLEKYPKQLRRRGGHWRDLYSRIEKQLYRHIWIVLLLSVRSG